MKHDQRLHCLAPKSPFIAVEALEYAAVEINKTQEAVGQLAGCAAKVICEVVEAVRLSSLQFSPRIQAACHLVRARRHRHVSRPRTRERHRHTARASGPAGRLGGAPAKLRLGSQEGRFLPVPDSVDPRSSFAIVGFRAGAP
jgi:hypothetical protein